MQRSGRASRLWPLTPSPNRVLPVPDATFRSIIHPNLENYSDSEGGGSTCKSAYRPCALHHRRLVESRLEREMIASFTVAILNFDEYLHIAHAHNLS